MPDDEAARIVAKLAAEAEFVDAGGFTLDPAAARRKLREHQLASEGAWALLVIEAGELAGVERIEVSEGLRALRVRLLGQAVARLAPFDQLDMLFAWAFPSASESELDAELVEARRLLALAVNAVLDRGVELSVTTAERCVRLRFAEGSSQRSESQGGPPALIVKIEVQPRRSLVQPAEALVETARRAGYGRAAVFVDGRRVGEGSQAALASRPLLLDGREIGRVGLRAPGHGLPRIVYAPHGVRLDAMDGGDRSSTFFAVVTRGVDRDLSLTRVVTNDAYDRVRAAIMAAQHEFAALEATVPVDESAAHLGSLERAALLRWTSIALASLATIGVVLTWINAGHLTGGVVMVVVVALVSSALSWIASIHARRMHVLFAVPKPTLTAKEEQLFFGDPTARK